MHTAKMRGQNWDNLRFVLCVARAQSFAEAARRLGVNESTVARRITQTEQRLGARLFERNRGVLLPTEAGAELIRRAEGIELEVQAAEGLVSGENELAAGTVRITSVPVIANHVLAPALPQLLGRHPALRIELIAEPRDLSLTKREADIALRLARPNRELRAIARRVGTLSYAAYGASHASDKEMPWITYDDRMTDLPQTRWIADLIARDRAASAQLVVNDAETILHCVKVGLGKSLLPTAIGDREPGLVRLEDCPESLSREVWLMVHPELRNLTRIQVVMNWLTAIAKQVFAPNAGVRQKPIR